MFLPQDFTWWLLGQTLLSFFQARTWRFNSTILFQKKQPLRILFAPAALPGRVRGVAELPHGNSGQRVRRRGEGAFLLLLS